MKEGRDDVDVDFAMRCGREEENCDLASETVEGRKKRADDVRNETALDILMKLPGVTKENAPLLIGEVSNLRELTLMTKKKLKTIIGNNNGSRLWDFLRKSTTSK